MSSKSTIMVSGDALSKRTEVLNQTEARIKTGSIPRFNIDELRGLQIRMTTVEFSHSRKRTTLNPCYFDPYPFDLTPPERETIDLDFPEYNPDWDLTPLESGRIMSHFFSHYLPNHRGPNVQSNTFRDEGWRFVYDQHYRSIREYGSNTWDMELLCRHIDSQRGAPHLKSIISSDLYHDDGETLLRGEILSLLGLIKRRQLIECEKQPILLFSLMGPQHLRFLQAHWDGTALVIQKSKIYDFSYKDDKLLSLLAVWFFSKPVGDVGLM